MIALSCAGIGDFTTALAMMSIIISFDLPVLNKTIIIFWGRWKVFKRPTSYQVISVCKISQVKTVLSRTLFRNKIKGDNLRRVYYQGN